LVFETVEKVLKSGWNWFIAAVIEMAALLEKIGDQVMRRGLRYSSAQVRVNKEMHSIHNKNSE
jgi:hypothetical protein